MDGQSIRQGDRREPFPSPVVYRFVGGLPQVQAPDERLVVDRSIGSALDRGFVAVLSVSLFVHCSVVFAINQRKTPPHEEEVVESLPFHASWLPLPRTRSETHAKDSAAHAGAAPRAPSPKSHEAKHDHAAMADDVRRHLQWLGGDGPGVGSGVADTLFDGRAPVTIEKALSGARNGADVDNVFLQSNRREGSSGASDIGRLAAPSSREVGLDERNVGKHLRVRVEDAEPTGPSSGCEPSVISKVVKRNLRAVAMCYEHELRLFPSLRGKLTVRIEVGADGRVEDVDVEEDALHNAEVARCITRTIRFWRFPPPGQSCPVAYPFVFVPMD